MQRRLAWPLSWAAAALLCTTSVQGYISGAFVLPHGSIAQSPENWNYSSPEAKAEVRQPQT